MVGSISPSYGVGAAMKSDLMKETATREADMHMPPTEAKVLLVGGPDVDARIELMRCLGDTFDLSAVGSHPALHDKFMTEGFGYHVYHLNRQLNPLSDLFTVCQLMFLFWRLKPHVVHTFDTKPGVWGCLTARLAGVPVVISTFTGLG